LQRLGDGGPNLSLSSCAIAARVKSQAPGSFLSTPSGVIAKTSRLQDWTVNAVVTVKRWTDRMPKSATPR